MFFGNGLRRVARSSALRLLPPVRPRKDAEASGEAGGGRVTRTPLFFSEEWKSQGEYYKVNPAQAVGNPNLELKLYGPEGKEILITGITLAMRMTLLHLWTGMCTSPCALASSATKRILPKYSDGFAAAHQNGHQDVRLSQSPFYPPEWVAAYRRSVRKGPPFDWLESDIAVGELKWHKLDPERIVTTGDWVRCPNLSKVDEVGFADLIPPSGHGQGGWSDVREKLEHMPSRIKREGAAN